MPHFGSWAAAEVTHSTDRGVRQATEPCRSV